MTAAASLTKLRRIRPGEYENDGWYVVRRLEEEDGEPTIHPFGYEYTPAAIYSWFVYNKATGDLHDAYETLREARRFVESSVMTHASGRKQNDDA